jgi:hypothetical protein
MRLTVLQQQTKTLHEERPETGHGLETGGERQPLDPRVAAALWRRGQFRGRQREKDDDRSGGRPEGVVPASH